MKLSERDIQKQIMDWLKLKRIFHYRQNSGAQLASYKGKQRFFRFGYKGAPDIVCVINGQYVGLEVKTSAHEQSLAQVEFGVELERAGGKYFVVHSLDEAIECLK